MVVVKKLLAPGRQVIMRLLSTAVSMHPCPDYDIAAGRILAVRRCQMDAWRLWGGRENGERRGGEKGWRGEALDGTQPSQSLLQHWRLETGPSVYFHFADKLAITCPVASRGDWVISVGCALIARRPLCQYFHLWTPPSELAQNIGRLHPLFSRSLQSCCWFTAANTLPATSY